MVALNTKIIAYYLPQYHEVKENDDWWGKGFTEWTHVKRAKPLFKEHIQPRIPLNGNYYDLMDKETVSWQTKIAKEYGVYGFAYYHYWFSGKKLLEKPAENLLHWKEIDQKFCFFWANHTWYKAENGEKNILIEQKYGEMADWKSHYEYCRKFFLDERYIKINNAPVFIIYMPDDIEYLKDMINYWNELAIEDGFSGIYFVENKFHELQDRVSELSSAVLYSQPSCAFDKSYKGNLWSRIVRKYYSLTKKLPHIPHKFKYFSISNFEQNIRLKNNMEYKQYLCLSAGWDNTSRHGCRGQVVVGNTPENFKKTLDVLYKRSLDMGNEFLFINAWNEWAEGMYLEPDVQWEYGYLEAIKDVVEHYKYC